MKTDVFKFNDNVEELEKMLDETEKTAAYAGLDKKQTIRLRLLAEELMSMLPEMMEYCEGEFWAESNGKEIELHVSVTLDDMLSADREKLMSVSTSGKNAAAKGIMGKIRAAAETMIAEYFALPVDVYQDFYSMGMSDPYYYTNAWSLAQYRAAAQQKAEEETWDELEKSIIANLADDVIVGIKGKKADIIVKKNFE